MLEKGKINPGEFQVLVIFFTIGSSILVAPALLAKLAKQDAWIAEILTLMLGLGFVFLYNQLSSMYPAMTFVELCEKALGKWLGKAASLLFLFYFYYLAAALLREIGDFLTTQVRQFLSQLQGKHYKHCRHFRRIPHRRTHRCLSSRVLSRDHEMRTDFFITVAKGGTAADILNVQTALERIPANKLFGALETSEKNWAPTKTVELDELINSIVSKGKEPVMTGIYVYGDAESGGSADNVYNASPAAGLRIDELGVFKKDKLLGWLTVDESKGFNYITDNVKSTVVNVPCENGKLGIETIRSKTKVNGKVENGKPKIEIQVHSEGNIGDVDCDIDLSKPEPIGELEKKYEQSIKDNMEIVIKKLQEDFKSDIFGFGDVIHRTDPKAWKRFEENWDEEFSNLEVTINVDAKIRRLGSIDKSFQLETKE